MENDNKKTFKDYVVQVAWGYWIVFIALFCTFWCCGIREPLGQFGDAFGVVTSFVTTLTLAGVAYTIYLQRKSFLIQKKELETQKEADVRNRRREERRDFERTFYNLLMTHRNILNSASETPSSYIPKELLSGHSMISRVRKDFIDSMKSNIIENIRDLPQKEIQKAKKEIAGFFDQHMPKFPDREAIVPIVRSLLFIIEYIEEGDKNCVDTYKKQQLIRYLKSTTTDTEIIFLFYYSAVKENGAANSVLKKYDFFEFLDPESLAHPTHIYLNQSCLSASTLSKAKEKGI